MSVIRIYILDDSDCAKSKRPKRTLVKGEFKTLKKAKIWARNRAWLKTEIK